MEKGINYFTIENPPKSQDFGGFLFGLVPQATQGRFCCSVGGGVGVTGREGVGGVGVGEGGVLGFSDQTGGLGLVGAVGLTVGSSEGSSEGEGLGDSWRSPKMLVGPEGVCCLKDLYSKPS